MPTYRDEAVVLRTQLLGEADRIVTLLTREHGKIRAVAKGIRRSSSKFGGRLEPFQHVALQCAQGRGSLEIITQAESLHASRIGSDYARFTAAQVLVETTDRLVSEEGMPALPHYRLLLGAILAMERGDIPAPLIVDSFLLRALAVAGYGCSIDRCADCGSPEVRWFSPQSGGAVCTSCRVPGSASLEDDDTAHLGALISGDWDVATAARRTVATRVDAMVVAYATWHLDRALRSLPYFER